MNIDATLPANISNVEVADPTDAATPLQLGTPPAGAAVVYIHVPRTAGTTMRAIVQRRFAPASLQHLYGNDAKARFGRFGHRSERERAQIRLLLGHFVFGMHEHLVGPTTYLSVVREPVDRIVSDYYYIVGNPHHEQHRFVTSQEISLRGFVECGLFPSNDNALVRTFAGIKHCPYGAVNREHLSAARKNILEHFAVLGLAERFDETLALLHLKLGWQGLYYVKQNVGVARPPRVKILAEDLAAIAARNALDIELYAFCREVFSAEVARQGARFDTTLDQQRSRNQQLMELREKAQALIGSHDFDGAARVADTAIEIDPSFAPAHHLLSVAAFHDGRFPAACAAAATALQCDPYDRQICRHAAHLLELSRRPDLARGVLAMHLAKFNASDEEILRDLARLDGGADRLNPLVSACSRMGL